MPFFIKQLSEGTPDEPQHGVLGSREHGGQNIQGADSRVEKSLGSRGTNLGSREHRKKSREQRAEEIK